MLQAQALIAAAPEGALSKDARRPMSSVHDARREQRISAVVPVSFNGATGLTRDVSASGVFIETERILPPGTRFELLLEFFSDRPHGPLVVRSDATVVRISETSEMRGMAAAIRWH